MFSVFPSLHGKLHLPWLAGSFPPPHLCDSLPNWISTPVFCPGKDKIPRPQKVDLWEEGPLEIGYCCAPGVLSVERQSLHVTMQRYTTEGNVQGFSLQPFLACCPAARAWHELPLFESARSNQPPASPSSQERTTIPGTGGELRNFFLDEWFQSTTIFNQS